jgi:hypothetical protein
MKSLPLALLLLVLATSAWADQVLQYEPALVEITGTLSKGKAEHPNGNWFNILILKLDAPASIKGDGKADSFNEDEDHITEIQVYSGDEAILKKMGRLDGKKAVLKGTLFHAQTAWHVRDLVMMVTDVKAAK